MGYKERVLSKIDGMEQRVQERKALWQLISDSFENEGADGVAEELAKRMDAVREKFDAFLTRLKDML